MFNCNELPKAVEHTNAYFRRFLIILFNQTIPEHEQDKDLAAKIIKAELSGIFNWVLDGLNRLTAQKGFTEGKTVQETLKNFREESDSVYQFIHEEGYQKSATHVIDWTPFYKRYQQFSMDSGFRALSIANFRKRLEDQNIFIQRKSSGYVVYLQKMVEERIQSRVIQEEWDEAETENPF